jgi:Nitrous oxidase accessory protein
MKKVIFIVLLLICVVFVSCEAKIEDDLVISTYDLPSEGYVIVRPDLSSDEVTASAIALRNAIGNNIKLTTDWIKKTEEIPISGKEIIIGETNRKQTTDNLIELKHDDYVIKLDTESERIIILGGSDEATEKAVDFFITNCLNSDNGMLSIPEDNVYMYKQEYKVNTILFNDYDLGDYVIISEDNNAAEIFRKYIIKISGINLRIDKKDKPEYNDKHKIIINSASDETLTISETDNNITISGGTYAVGFFLIDYFGFGNDDLTANLSVTHYGTKIYLQEDFPVMEPISIFVAPDGNNSNDGSIDKPLQTLAAAKEMAKELKSISLSPIIVNFRAGEYFIDTQVVFTAEDSGSQITPITYQAYNDEKVMFNGGVKIDASYITSVTDKAVLDRIIDKDAASKLLQLDYSNIEIEFPEMMVAGSSGKITEMTPEIYINGNALSPSRYPNDIDGSAYLRTTDAVTDEVNYKTEPFTMTYSDSEDRAATYWTAETLKNLYIYGFVAHDWIDGVYKIADFDMAARTFTTTVGSDYAPRTDTRICFFNVLEEIDSPGESFIDRENKKIYFYPTADMATAEVYISKLGEYMLSLTDVNNITFKGIEFAYTRNRIIDAINVDNFVVDNCTIAHTSYNAITINGYNSAVRNSHIFDTAKGGINFNGGDRAKLISGNNVIENNTIHDNARIFKTYQPAISAQSVGLLIRNNELYNNPHELIAIGANDVIIEYNEIYNAVLESADMGAIYYGRDPSVLGVEIRYNYFHDIGNQYGGIGQQSIFSDDGNTMPHIHHNIFYRGSSTTEMGGTTSNSFPIKAHGSQFGLIENNIIVDSPTAAMFQPWTTNKSTMIQDTWLLWVYDITASTDHNIWTKIKSNVDIFSDLYREKYKNNHGSAFWDYITPELYDTLQELYKSGNAGTAELNRIAKENAPAYTNVFKNNVVIKVDYDKDGKAFIDNGVDINTYRANDDILDSGNSMFTKYGEDFKLTAEGLAEIQKIIPEFENIPTELIGRK